MKIDITIKHEETSYDISVDNGQKISSTFKVLAESIKSFPIPSDGMLLMRFDDKQLLDFDKTYEEQEIFQGQILEYKKEKKVESLFDDNKDSISYKECKSETYKVADFGLKTISDFEKITNKNVGLLECKNRIDGEDITFFYNIYEKRVLSEIRSLDYRYKYRFLVNFPDIFASSDYYSYKFEDDNIYFDDNMLPYIKKRTLKYNTDVDETSVEYDEVLVYKAMIFYVLCGNKTFTQGLEAGESVYSKEKNIQKFIDLESVDEIREALKEELIHKSLEENKNKKKVNKIWDFIRNLLLVGMIIFVGFAAYKMYTWNTVLQYDNQIIAGNKAYTRKDYFACIEALKPILVDSMDYDTKYILATSYARTENMNREELQNVVERITFSSSEKELEYWIYLGRGEYVMAEDTAKVVMNDQLLVYAYMKELDYLQLSTDVTGEEKSSRIGELQSAIKELAEKYSQDDEEEAQ